MTQLPAARRNQNKNVLDVGGGMGVREGLWITPIARAGADSVRLDDPRLRRCITLPDHTMEVLRDVLTRGRLSVGLSQEEVAHLAGISLPTYRRLESFRDAGDEGATPTLRTIVRALRALDAGKDFVAALATESARSSG